MGTTSARAALAEALRAEARADFWSASTTRTSDLALEVEGVGPVPLPISGAVARQLIGIAQPARFGRGEETLTDPAVRHTWEVPKHLVRAVWDDEVMALILKRAQVEMGIPDEAELSVEPHSLLVYEAGQFFLPHQDSEKNDLMVGTIVVTLPSVHSGGELVVRHGGEEERFPGSETDLSIVTFYADCRHEVTEVRTGYRVALTYNLLARRDESAPRGDEATVRGLGALLREHFTTPTPTYGGRVADPPGRLVYLLDHEYTPRSLGWSALKGADVRPVALLRAAAEHAGCEAVLALADVKTTHSAYEAGDLEYEDRYWEDDDAEDDDDAGGGDYDIQELIDETVTLTYWTGPDGGHGEQISLDVDDAEVCDSASAEDFEPHASEYEGYMGNWGNTLDRWYHRAAVVVWPREQAFANRARSSPAWALTHLAAMAAAGDLAGAQAAAATLEPFWDSALAAASPTGRVRAAGYLGEALRVADALADEAAATMLLRPFQLEDLTTGHIEGFGALVARYGEPWATALLRLWSGQQKPAWSYSGRGERRAWLTDQLPGLCSGLHAAPDPSCQAVARSLLGLAEQWVTATIGTAFGSSSPSVREQALGELAGPVAAVLTAGAAVGVASTRETVRDCLRQGGDGATALAVPALRAGTGQPGNAEAVFGALAADCAAWLRSRLARPQRAADDWSVELAAGGCACELCTTLREFLAARDRRTLEWPLAKDRRQHVHSRIDAAELPVSHLTRRQGRPYTLVLDKTGELFTAATKARSRDQADLDWLDTTWKTTRNGE